MHKFRAIASRIHSVVKFHTMSGVGAILTKRRLGQMKKNQDINNANTSLNDLTPLEEK